MENKNNIFTENINEDLFKKKNLLTYSSKTWNYLIDKNSKELNKNKFLFSLKKDFNYINNYIDSQSNILYPNVFWTEMLSKLEIFKLCFDFDWQETRIRKIVNKITRKWIEYKPNKTYFTDWNWIGHLVGTTSFALPIHKDSNMIVIDIDSRSQIESKQNKTHLIVDKVVKLLGSPNLIEYSEESKGYHLYYKMNYSLNSAQKKTIIKYLLDTYKITIEIKNSGDYIRLPLSIEYSIVGEYNKKNKLRIKSLNDIPKSRGYDRTLFFTTNIINNNNFHLNIYNLMTEKKEYPKELYNIIKDDYEILKAQRLYSALEVSIQNNMFKECKDTPLEYGCSTRYETQPIIGFHLLKENNNATFEDFIKKCEYYNDGTSKDMALPKLKRDKILLKVWNFCTKEFLIDNIKSNKKETGMFENSCITKDLANKFDIKFLVDNEFFKDTSDDLEFSESTEDKLYNIIKFNLQLTKDYKYNKINKTKINKIIMDAIQVYKYIYETKDYRDLYKYEYEKPYKELEKGVPLSETILKCLTYKYNIQNIKRIIKLLINCNLIEPIYNKFGTTWIFQTKYQSSNKIINHVKHYSINTNIEFLYNILINYINSSNYSDVSFSLGFFKNIYNIDKSLNNYITNNFENTNNLVLKPPNTS